jgi:hypothetical protein
VQQKYTVGGFYCKWCLRSRTTAPPTNDGVDCNTLCCLLFPAVVCPEQVKMLLAKVGFEIVKESAAEGSPNTYLNRDFLVVVEKRC